MSIRKVMLLILTGIPLLFVLIAVNAGKNDATAIIKVKDGKGHGTGTFCNLDDQNTDFELFAKPESPWVFNKDAEVDKNSGWVLRLDRADVASATNTMDNPLSSPESFASGLNGTMSIPDGTGPGKPIPWSADSDTFYIYSTVPAVKYEKVIVPWAGKASFSAKGGKKETIWSLTLNSVEVKSGTGVTFSIIEDDFKGDAPNIKEPGTYTLIAWRDKKGKAPSDSMTVIIPDVDLDVDTNNNGSIDNNNDGEDEYEEYAPGVIVCKDRKGDGNKFYTPPDHLVQLKIRKLSEEITDGELILKVSTGKKRIKIWEDAEKTTPVSLPKKYNIETDTIPETLYIDGIKTGNAVIKLVYKTKEGVKAGEDKVAVHVTGTISWSPDVNQARFWEPCEWDSIYSGALPPEPANAVFNAIKKQGWGTLADRFTPFESHPVLGSMFGGNTLANFKKLGKSGFLCIYTHGNAKFIAGIYAFDKKSIKDWIANEKYIKNRKSKKHNLYFALVKPEWLVLNWSANLNKRKAITAWISCSAAAKNGALPPDQSSNMARAGGRVQFGYNATVDTGTAKDDFKKLLSRMNGTKGNAKKRVAKDAYDAGGFDNRFKMYGNGYTTLCPSSLATFPSANPGERKGWGCIIFDTYMMGDYFPANQAVIKTNGTCSVSDFRWVSNGYGMFCDGFEFDNENGGGATMKADADKCQADGIGNLRLDGDGEAPNGDDWPWSF